MSDFQGYPKYQISKFLDSKRDYQVVIRTDDFEELKDAMRLIKPLVKSLEARDTKDTKTPDILDQYPEQAPCPDHPGMTTYRRDSKFKTGDPYYYSHKVDDQYCNLKPKQIINKK